jgi:hypothetical protein
MSFEDWFYEQEGFGLRAERFLEDKCERDMQLFINMKKWLEAAYEAGKENREWVGLTKDEIMDIIIDVYGSPYDVAVDVQSKLKEKNT